jgi:hypothetical protein
MTKMPQNDSDERNWGPGGDAVLVLRPYPLRVGQKIFIESGPRHGDWEIIEVGDRKIKLRCPVSHKEVETDRFCYVVEEASGIPWPHQD